MAKPCKGGAGTKVGGRAIKSLLLMLLLTFADTVADMVADVVGNIAADSGTLSFVLMLLCRTTEHNGKRKRHENDTKTIRKRHENNEHKQSDIIVTLFVEVCEGREDLCVDLNATVVNVLLS